MVLKANEGDQMSAPEGQERVVVIEEVSHKTRIQSLMALLAKTGSSHVMYYKILT